VCLLLESRRIVLFTGFQAEAELKIERFDGEK
jgi:hypothetical protein